MLQPIKIAVWNANGLVHHKLELDQFLFNNNIDIMLVSETHFTNHSFMRFNNYELYSTNHPAGTARGGTAVLIKKSIKHELELEYKTPHIQSTTISIKDHHGALSVSSIYCPPRHSIKKVQYEHFFNTLGSRYIVGGDFNAKHNLWGSRTFNPKGRELYKCIQSHNLHQVSTGEPTYWPSDPNKYPDVIDFCICKGIPSNLIRAESSLDLSSDHSPIIVSLNSAVISSVFPPKLHNKQTNWPLFKNHVETLLPLHIPLKTDLDIEDAIEIFNSAIQRASWLSTPPIRNRKCNAPADPKIREQIQSKRKLRKEWQRHRFPSDKTKLNKATKDLRLALSNNHDKSTEHFLSKLTNSKTTDYSLWRATRNTLRPTLRCPPIKSSTRTWAKSDQQKANLFGEHLSKVFEPFQSQDQQHDSDILEYLDSPAQLDLPINPFHVNEVKTAISKINIKKAPGYDLITGKIIKELPPTGVLFLTQLFNAIIKLSHFPLQWKVAEITMVPKPGKPLEEVCSYRPISLLPILSKLLEKLILHRMKPILHSKRLIPDHQFGFREQHSTVEQVHRVYNTVREALEQKKFCSAVFLDITQAFDKVWHLGLLYKLKLQLPHPYYDLLKSYLSNRSFRVKYNDDTSELFQIKAGVPQGSVLGPTLYTLYTADLPIDHNTTIATFADDTVVMASDSNPVIASENLQSHLTSIDVWLNKWRIKANASKSVHVTFTLRKSTCPVVTMNNIPIPQSETAKYLGIHLDRRLTWQHHIFTKRKQLGLRTTTLNWLIGSSSKMSLKNKILVYKTIIKPIWTYGIQLWGTAAKSNLEILQRFQSKTLRQIANAPQCITNDIIHRDLQIPTIQEEIKKYSSNYLKRLEEHPNTLAADLTRRSGHTRRLQRLIPADLFS